jgi:hypothetical protein
VSGERESYLADPHGGPAATDHLEKFGIIRLSRHPPETSFGGTQFFQFFYFTG